MIDIDEWNYLDDSSDDGWVDDNDDFTSVPEKKETKVLDSFPEVNVGNYSPKKGNLLELYNQVCSKTLYSRLFPNCYLIFQTDFRGNNERRYTNCGKRRSYSK